MSGTRTIALVTLCALGAAPAGCGGGSSKSPSVPSATSTQTTTGPASVASTTTTTTSRHRTKPSPPQTVTAVTTSPAPPGATAPDGLRPGGGYASYDNCMGSCGGAVPSALQRPLHLPSGGCPASDSHAIAGTTVLGNGPVGPAQASALSINSFIGSSWSGGRATWFADPGYAGPILIRGRQLDGSHAVGFGAGHVPYDQLQLNDSAGPRVGGARQWPAFTRVRGPGCYAYQVDGTDFSNVIVFRAR